MNVSDMDELVRNPYAVGIAVGLFVIWLVLVIVMASGLRRR